MLVANQHRVSLQRAGPYLMVSLKRAVRDKCPSAGIFYAVVTVLLFNSVRSCIYVFLNSILVDTTRLGFYSYVTMLG